MSKDAYRITPEDVREAKRHLLQEKWNLPTLMLPDLEVHYLLQWEYEHFLIQLAPDSHQPIIVRNGIQFHVRLHDCKVSELRNKNIWLSFRKLRDYPIAYVLVKPVVILPSSPSESKEPKNEQE